MRGSRMLHARYVPLIVAMMLVLPSVLSPTVAAPQPSTFLVYSPTLYGRVFERTAAKAMKEKYNVEIIFQDGNSAEMIAKLKASQGKPEATVACPDAGGMLIGEAAGFWDNLDLSKLTNLKDIQSFAKSPPYGKVGIVISSATSGIQYHTEAFRERGWLPPKNWKDLARPEFRGRVGLTTTVSSGGIAMLSFWSRMEGAPRGDVTPGIRFARSLVESGNVAFFPNRSGEITELMQRGEMWISTAFMEAALQGAARGLPFGWVFPAEGTYILPVGCSVVRNGPGSKELANLFINEVIGEETQRELALDRWSIPVRIGLKLPPQYVTVLPLTEVRIRAIKARTADFAEFAEFRDRWHDLWVRTVEQR